MTRESRISAFYPLVYRIAKRVRRVVPAASIDDLVGDGSIGLIRSVDTYDATRGVAFESYARKVIVGTMLNGLRRMDPIPERIRRRVRQAEEARYRIAQDLGTLPSMNEMESRTEGLRRARTVTFRHTTLSLDMPLPQQETGLLDRQSDPLHCALESSSAREMLEVIALLPDRQRKIVLLHYYQRLSLHAISARLNVTPQRVSQLHLSALAKLRMRIQRA